MSSPFLLEFMRAHEARMAKAPVVTKLAKSALAPVNILECPTRRQTARALAMNKPTIKKVEEFFRSRIEELTVSDSDD